MQRVLSTIVAVATLTFPGVTAFGQPIADHLKCYRVKDAAPKATYTADLTGLAPEPGCIIKVPAKFLCVETTKTNVHPTPPGGGPSGPNAGTFLCYALRCPRAKLAPVTLADQFGSRTITPHAPPLLCAPAAPPTTTTSTTTTSTTTTTTSTTFPTCGTPDVSGFCGGPCPAGSTCASTSSTTCGCVPDAQLCNRVFPPPQSCGGACPHVTDSCIFISPTQGCACVTVCGQIPACNGACLPGRNCVPGLGACFCN